MQLLTTDQAQNIFITQPFARGTLRLLYQRCQESEAQSSPCQDYAAIASEDSQSLCLCVCDGVGGSYQGDFAARYLATALLNWLIHARPSDAANHALAASLVDDLARWARQGQDGLAQITVAPDTPTLVREVMEETRATYGSETVFLACRIDLGAPEMRAAQVLQPARMFMCWMGNVAAQIFTAPDRAQPFNLPGDDHQRWSTARGICGNVAIRALQIKDLHRFIVYTDGFAGKGTQIWQMTDTQLQASARDLLALPTNDDMTVLDIQWSHKDHSTTEG
jgi:hypothetical protein